MSNLMPQKRLDKTGKLVTRHVRVESKATNASSLPAPAISAPKKKAALKKPLAKQLEVQSRMPHRGDYEFDPRLYKAFDIDPANDFPILIITANEVEIYDMLSMMDTDTAVMMLSMDFRSAEDAVVSLRDNGLGDLIVDRRDMMNDAFNRRIDSFAVMKMNSRFGDLAKNADPETLINAARLTDTLTLDTFKLEGRESSFPEEVLRGNIAYDDVMTLGLTLLHDKRYLTPEIVTCLTDIHLGRASYEIDTLKHLVDHADYGASYFRDTLKMTAEYGDEFIRSVNDFDNAIRIDDKYRWMPTSQRADFIKYSEAGNFKAMHRMEHEDVAKLFQADVPIEYVKEMIASGLGVDQIAVAYKNNGAKAVASGWL